MKPVKVSDDVWVNPDRVIWFESAVSPNRSIITCQGVNQTVHVQSAWPASRVALALGWTGE